MRLILAAFLACIVTCGEFGVAAERPAIVLDFESGDFQGWRIVEGDFQKDRHLLFGLWRAGSGDARRGGVECLGEKLLAYQRGGL